MLTGENWFGSLAGKWLIERQISDGSHFSGEGQFNAQGEDSFVLSEQGALVLPDAKVLKASRTWVWSRTEPMGLDIHYPGDRGAGLYHRLVLKHHGALLVGTGHHVCGADTYTGEYRISGSRIEIGQSVQGPAKDYTMTSVFVRNGDHR
ncbi:MAG: DUF6314 family protein [Rhizobiaceae bacterium]